MCLWCIFWCIYFLCMWMWCVIYWERWLIVVLCCVFVLVVAAASFSRRFCVYWVLRLWLCICCFCIWRIICYYGLLGICSNFFVMLCVCCCFDNVFELLIGLLCVFVCDLLLLSVLSVWIVCDDGCDVLFEMYEWMWDWLLILMCDVVAFAS